MGAAPAAMSGWRRQEESLRETPFYRAIRAAGRPPDSWTHFSFMDGSPKRTQDLRTSGSDAAALARVIASPRVSEVAPKSSRNSAWFMIDCWSGSVSVDDVHTPIAPPFGAFISVSA